MTFDELPKMFAEMTEAEIDDLPIGQSLRLLQCRPDLHEKQRQRRRAKAEKEAAEWVSANPRLLEAWAEAESEDIARHKAKQERKRLMDKLANTGAPERCAVAIAAGLNATTATAAVETFMASDKTFLLLSGSPGCGKTLAACVALKDGGRFARAVEVSRLSLFDAEDRANFDALKKTRLLVLDDLGAEMLHDGWRPALDELLDYRYGAMKPTILTTNLPPTSEDEARTASFRGRYGARIADRIRHDGLVEKCGDKSLRVRP